MKEQFVNISGYEIDIRATSSNGAEEVISLLIKLNKQKGLSISQILETLNDGKKRKLNRTNIDRVIQNLKRFEPQIIHSKKISNTTYYWISQFLSDNKTKGKKSIIYQSQGRLNTEIVQKERKQINSATVFEKDLYSDVQEWLSQYVIDGVKFKFQVSGGGFLDNKSKFSNPDIIGINESQNIEEYKVVSVEVKRELENKAELIGFAQCCSYLLFSNYVLFVCLKPQLPEHEDRVTRITQLCEHFGIGLRFIGENGIRVKPRLNEPKASALKHRIIEMFQK
jgi:hypothetical protein